MPPLPKALPQASEDFDGLITNDTRTKFGLDFYRAFYEKWVPPTDVTGYSITIREYPLTLRFVRVAVLVNRVTVATLSYIPANDRTQNAAQQAVNNVLLHLEAGNHLNDGINYDDLFGAGEY